MSTTNFDTPEIHRHFAVTLFNRVWNLLDLDERTPDENIQMTHAAHASRYHWGECGTFLNLARGEWQISRVYAVQGLVHSAKHHAEYCLSLCQENDLGVFDLGFAYEALARSYSLENDKAMAEEYIKAAEEIADQIGKEEDRDWLLSNLDSII